MRLCLARPRRWPMGSLVLGIRRHFRRLGCRSVRAALAVVRVDLGVVILNIYPVNSSSSSINIIINSSSSSLMISVFVCLWVALFIFYIIFHRRRRLRLFPPIIFVDGLEGRSVVWRGLHCCFFFSFLHGSLYSSPSVCSPSPSFFLSCPHNALFFSIIDIAQHIHPAFQTSIMHQPKNQQINAIESKPLATHIFSFRTTLRITAIAPRKQCHIYVLTTSQTTMTCLFLTISVHPSIHPLA